MYAFYIGLLGGIAMVGYLAIQWWAVSSRKRFEARRQALELEILQKKLDDLNRKAVTTPITAWNGYRKFSVARKVSECDDTFSFYLTPHNNKPLPSFKPGQYLTFEITPKTGVKPLIRCYSLSDGYLSSDHYRITIKRALPPRSRPAAPPGIISSHFCDEIQEGDILDVKAPTGNFFLDVEANRPVVLISGGIGITPMLAMARTLKHIGDDREVHFFFGCRSSADHMMRGEMEELLQDNPNFHLHVCYSRPLDTDKEGEQFKHSGRVTIDLIKAVLPSSNFEYYLCGPGPFMDTLVMGLKDWGVPKKDIKFEAFGPATVKSVTRVPFQVRKSKDTNINFSRSGKTLDWDPNAGSILDFAEGNGITTIEGGCRAGSCGSCLVAIKEGQVEYMMEPGDPPEDGSCLTCICRPKGKLVIDA